MRAHRFLIAVVLNLAAFAAQAQLTPLESEWVELTRPFIREARATNTPIMISVVENPDPNESPVQMQWDSAKRSCTFMMNMRENILRERLERFAQTRHELEVIRQFMLAHEFAHCLYFRDYGGVGTPLQLEAIADIYALEWFTRNRPADQETALRFLGMLRGDMRAANDEHHNTLSLVRLYLSSKSVVRLAPLDEAVFVVMGRAAVSKVQ